ncbi:MAG: hypothetical protein ACI4TX_00055, partial [Christensenellales bacterium]
IQVSTPAKKSNVDIPHDKGGGEVNCLVDVFDSYEKTLVNRCKEVDLKYLRKSFCYSEVKAYIQDFNYQYAVKALKRENFAFDNNLITLCEIGNKYINSEFDNLKSACKSSDFYLNATKDVVLEEVLNAYNIMKIKEDKKLLSDFVCRLTPLLFLLAKKVVNEVFPLNSIMDAKDKVIISKLQNSELKDMKKFANAENDFYISSWSLIEIYENRSGDAKILSLLKDLRNIEETIRNKVAHSVTYVSESEYKKITNETPKQTLVKLENLIKCAFGSNVKDDDFKFFNRLNNAILKELSQLLNS